MPPTTRRRRRARLVYRVLDEQDYLAGADPFADWEASTADSPVKTVDGSAYGPNDPAHGARALRRFAGAALLTGAVGAAGAAIGLTVLHGRSGSAGPAELAERPRFSTTSPRARARGSAARVTRRLALDRRPSHHAPSARRPSRAAPAPARVPAAEAAPAEVQAAPAEAQVAPTEAQAAPRPQAQSEFGFERR